MRTLHVASQPRYSAHGASLIPISTQLATVHPCAGWRRSQLYQAIDRSFSKKHAGVTPLSYFRTHHKECAEEIPGPQELGVNYLLLCERDLQLQREFAEAEIRLEGMEETPPMYCNAGLLPLHHVQSINTQTEEPTRSVVDAGTLTSDLEVRHTRNLVMATIVAWFWAAV